MKNNNKQRKHFPLKLIIIPIWLLTIITLFIIYIVVAFNKPNLKDTLKDGFKFEKCPTIVCADKIGEDGFLKGNASSKDLKYAYSSEIKDLKVGLYAKTYKLPTETTDGEISFYISFNSKRQDIKVSECKVLAASKWHNYSSASTSVYNSYYTNEIVSSDKMSFYNSTRQVTISKEQKFPKKFVMGLKKVKSPNLYVYVKYTIASEENEYIISYDYDSYFQSSQTQIPA